MAVSPLENLPGYKDEFDCPINLTVMTDPIRVLPCNHTFNRDVIEKWVAKSNTCPLDRREITSLEPNETLRQEIEAVVSDLETISNPEQMIQGEEAVFLVGIDRAKLLRVFEKSLVLKRGILDHVNPDTFRVRLLQKNQIPHAQYTGPMIDQLYGQGSSNWQVVLRNDGYQGFELSQIF